MDLGVIAEAVPVPAYMKSSNNFKLDVSILQQTLENAQGAGITVKALILCSPNNPMGYIYTKPELIEILEWTRARVCTSLNSFNCHY